MKHTLKMNKHKIIYCTVCKGAEGTLPIHCPKRELMKKEKEKIKHGLLDYKNNTWIKGLNYNNTQLFNYKCVTKKI